MSEEPKKSKTPSPFEQEVGAGDEGKENLQANGLISNGLEDGGFRSVHRLFTFLTLSVLSAGILAPVACRLPV